MLLIEFLPLLAAVAAVPQLLPQLLLVVRRRRPEGVSPAWAMLTAVGNLGWLAYFTSTGLWTAAVPATICALLAGAIVVALDRIGAPVGRGVAIGTAWLSLLATVFWTGGPAALGAMMAGAFVVQVIPSLWSAWRSHQPAGVSRPTWTLIGAEVACWGTVGLLDGRPPLLVLGATGLVAVAAMLWLTRPGRGLAVSAALIPAPPADLTPPLRGPSGVRQDRR